MTKTLKLDPETGATILVVESKKSDLFVSNTGRMTCKAHGGHYLNSELDARPEANYIITPLDVWERLTEFEAASLRDDLATMDLCEGCQK